MTLEMLKAIAALLRGFLRAGAAEIVYREKGRLLHAKSLAGRPPVLSGWRENRPGARTLLGVLETAPAGALGRLKSRPAAKAGPRRQVLSIADARSGTGHVFLRLLSRRAVTGLVVLAFPEPARLDGRTRDLLARLAGIISLALAHNLSRFELRERVKELTCMYSIANLAAAPGRGEAAFLQQAVELLPPAYLYPEITQARIVLDDRTYQTAAFRESPQAQRAEIMAGNFRRGTIEVVCLEPRPELDEGPFLSEERRLLDSVAAEIALILERRQAEVEQERLKEQLRHADRLATIGKLAAGVAHELNEPLTGILGFAELLKELPQMPRQAAGDLGRIEAAALHAREVVRKLLLFARQIAPRPGRVGVNRLVREVLAFLAGRLSEKDIAVRARLGEPLPEILADEAQIRQILMNLCLNALQAMEKGGRIDVATRARGEEIVVSIRDNGPGIPEEIRDKIFLPFFTTKDVDTGTGLGLSVVHGIVQAHRGRIEVSGAPGRGAEFRVYLPVAGKAGP
jgi:signal transduction histidine kinase